MIEDYISGKKSIAVVGLGYIGLSLCIGFGKVFKKVTGFDINEERVKELKSGYDKNSEFSAEDLKASSVDFTLEQEKLKNAGVIIIAVQSPVNQHKIPDLSHLKTASELVGKNLSAGSIVVYESTVYPGVTEEICLPILQMHSGLKAGLDFKIGYSPERINPGDRSHCLENIVKIVAGQDTDTTQFLAELYGAVVKAGIYKAPDIKTAEAAKVIENIQRDINIAFVNELAMLFKKLGLDTLEVLNAAKTKWNFIPFEPGLVGGHCIGVDPYYLTFKAKEAGYNPEIILSGRKINDNMGRYIASQTIKELIKSKTSFENVRVLIMGFTFKENIRDIRNTRVKDIYDELLEFGIKPFIYDPNADKNDVLLKYAITLIDDLSQYQPYDCIIAAVKHDIFKNISLDYLLSLCKPDAVLIDVKSFFERDAVKSKGFRHWRL